MQAKTGPVVPFVIRECRYCAGRADADDADVESVAAPVKILSPTRKWLLRPFVGRGDRASIILRKCSRHGGGDASGSAVRRPSFVLRGQYSQRRPARRDDMAAHILGHHAESLTQIRPLRPSDYCSISAHLRGALAFFPLMAFVKKRPQPRARFQWNGYWKCS